MAALASDVACYQMVYGKSDSTEYQKRSLDSAHKKHSYLNSVYPVQSFATSNSAYYHSLDSSSLPSLPESPPVSSAAHSFRPHEYVEEQGSYCSGDGITYSLLSGDEAYPVYSPSQYTAKFNIACEPATQYTPNENAYRYQGQQSIAMGSGSSLMTDLRNKNEIKNQSKSKRSSSSSSDNGGFESGTPKPVLGVKQKLRYSLDKINLKPPFRWNSSEKISRNSTSASKNKNKSNRRYSDSSTSFLAVNPDKKKKSKDDTSVAEDRSKKNSVKSGISRIVRPYSAGRNVYAVNNGSSCLSPSASDNHDYVNLSAVNIKHLKSQSQGAYRRSDLNFQENVLDSNSTRLLNDYYVTHSSNNYQETAVVPSQHPRENKDTAARAKGTWKMLKTAKTKQVPIKASSHQPYAALLPQNFGTSVDFPSSEMLQEQDSLTPSSVHGDNCVDEPPKLAPVSGKLLLDKNCDNTIVRPTAFKPVVRTSRISSVTSPFLEKDRWESSNADTMPYVEPYTGLDENRQSLSNDSNNSDSGRHSSTSIPVGVAIDSRFSCSGSEGYESARISSSTTHSAMQDQDCNHEYSSQISKAHPNDAILELESRVREKQDEIQLLKRSFEDNEKTLHSMVFDDHNKARESDVLEFKQKYSKQLKSQKPSLARTKLRAEQQYRIMHEEQQQLHDTNKELEERIKSMTDAIDAQSRQNEDLAELKARLDESEIEMQQKRGEISLLKSQLKEKQAELTQRASEVVMLKSLNRDLGAKLTQREAEEAELNTLLNERNYEIAELERSLNSASTSGLWSRLGSNSGSDTLKSDSSARSDAARDDISYLAPPSPKRLQEEECTSKRQARHNGEFANGEKEELLRRLHAAERRCVVQEKLFEREKRQWAEDKSKVIKYQKQLQGNYVQMCQRSHALERQVNLLTTRLQAVGISAAVAARVNEENLVEKPSLCYPMEI